MIHIVQALCPSRHAIMAVLYDPFDTTRVGDPIDVLRHAVEDSVAAKAIDPWCGICQAKIDTWFYQDAPTLWRTMAEALPAAKAIEAAQRETAGNRLRGGL